MKTLSEIGMLIANRRLDEATAELETIFGKTPDGAETADRCSYWAGCSAMAFSQTGTLTETTFCIRQLEQDRILQEMALM